MKHFAAVSLMLHTALCGTTASLAVGVADIYALGDSNTHSNSNIRGNNHDLAAAGIVDGDGSGMQVSMPAWRVADTLNLWPGTAPGERPGTFGNETQKCLAPSPIKDCKDLSVTDVTVPTLTPYLVANATAAVVVAPGGAYSILAINREGTDIAAWLNSIGVSAFLLKYRVPARSWLPFGGAPLMDAQRAMGLVRKMADDGKITGLNSSRIGFMGFSAGAHLTGHLSVAWKERSYPKVDAADDKQCRPDFSMMIYPWQSVMQAPVNATLERASAVNVTQDNPPTMLVQAEDDPVHVENALYYWLALKQKGAPPSELHLYPRGGHGYGRCTISNTDAGDEVCTWPDRGQAFMQTLGIAPR